MDKNYNLLAVIFGLLALGGVVFLAATQPDASQTAAQIKADQQQQYGSVVGPLLLSPYFSVNNFGPEWFYHTTLANASSTCSFTTPNATTTLAYFNSQITNSYGGTYDVEFGYSSAIDATTTTLGHNTGIVSGNRGTFIASTTLIQGGKDSVAVLPPLTHLTMKIGSTSPTIAGTCNAKIIQN